MNIPKSTIEPFIYPLGFIGIPKIHHELIECANIIHTLERYAAILSKIRKDSPGNKQYADVSDAFEEHAKRYGAKDALCELISSTPTSQMYSLDFYVHPDGQCYHMYLWVFACDNTTE